MSAALVRRMAQAGLAAGLIAMSSCSGCPGGTATPTIRARDTFMLAYVTGNANQIHVRHSDDGLEWTASPDPGGGTLGGIGAAASNDATGATRLLVYRGASGRLRVRAGLGTSTWESQDQEFPGPDVFSAPDAVHLEGRRWLISTTASNGFALFHRFDTLSRQFTDQTPVNLPNLENDRPARTPAVINLNGRIVAAWPRFFFNGTGPISLQFVVGTVAAGGVQWQQAYAGAFDEPGFSPVKLGPVLAHDGTRFFAGMVRKANGSDTHRLFVYRSDDGVTWQPETSHDVPVDGLTPKLRLAARGNGTMVAAVFGDTRSVLLRRSNSWTGLNFGSVFGDDPLPDADNFALITAGQPRVPLFVNRTSTAAQEDGTASRPFKTIAAALQIAHPGDTVTIQDNTMYTSQQLVVPRGVTLQASSPGLMPILQGRNDAPLLTLERNAVVRDLELDGGQQVVRVDLGTALQGLAGRGTASAVTVEGCKISNALQGGVRLSGPNTLTIGGGRTHILTLAIRRNWFTNNAGGAIVSEATGADAGTLIMDLDITDNVIMNQRDGIRLRAEGRGATSGPPRTFYTGRVFNNLVSGGRTGLSLEAIGGGEVGRADDALVVSHNTINGSEVHAIVAEALDGNSRVRVALTANLLANSGSGYTEFSARTTPSAVRNNLFFQNGVHFHANSGGNVSATAGLNGAPVNGSNNLVADPRFDVGSFRFGTAQINSGEGNFFLAQGGANPSPAVNAGANSATNAGLGTRSTRTDYTPDTGVVDIGFHYRNPS